jgi:AraC-like DNA-binding protein
MLYAELLPGDALASHVAAYWHFEVRPDAGEILHSVPLTGGCILSVAVARGGVVLAGPRVTPLQVPIRSGDRFVGALFWPGGATPLFRRPASDVRDRVLMVSELVDPAWSKRLTAALRGRVGGRSASTDVEIASTLDSALGELLEGSPALDDKVMATVLRIIQSDGGLPISALADAVGLSPRHLRRRFVEATGLTPKELVRIRRLRKAAVDATRAHAVNWSDLAARRGFADQAHMTGEFRRLTGHTPVSFLRHTRRIAHGKMRD